MWLCSVFCSILLNNNSIKIGDERSTDKFPLNIDADFSHTTTNEMDMTSNYKILQITCHRLLLCTQFIQHAKSICGGCSTSVCKSFVHHINCASLRFFGVLVFDGKCVLDVMDESQELFIINTSTWMFKRLNTDHHFYIHTNITARQHSILLSALCDHIQFIYTSVYAINPSRFRMILYFVDKCTRNDTIWYSSCSFQSL